MPARLYSYPEIYDAMYKRLKDYDKEVEFIIEKFNDSKKTDRNDVLILGCGTGEHAKRLEDRGFNVQGIDKSEAMVRWARKKSEATFRVGEIPDIEVSKKYALVLVPFTVINYLKESELSTLFSELKQYIVDGGVLIFDNKNIEVDRQNKYVPDFIALNTELGDIVRITQVQPIGDNQVHRNNFVFVQRYNFSFIDIHELTIFDNSTIRENLEEAGFCVKNYQGYRKGDPITVFVAH